MAGFDESLILAPFAREREERNSARYAWDNAGRGDDPFVILQFTREGEGLFRFGGREYRVPPGHAFIAIPPEESFYGHPGAGAKPWAFSWINFYGELAIRLWRDLRERAGPVIPLAPPAARRLRRLIESVGRRPRPDAYALSAETYAFYVEILRRLRIPARAEEAQGPVRQAVSHLRSHYRESLGMKEMAALAGMSREHFTRLFTRETGRSPAAFLRGLRLEAAARLLRTTGLPVAEVAFRSGFASATKLGVFFRRRYRTSPSRYRQEKG